MSRAIHFSLFTFLFSHFIFLFSSCYSKHQNTEVWKSDSTAIDSTLLANKNDSLAFALLHHYSVGYNFIVRDDSLNLCTEIPSRAQQLAMMPDSCSVYRDNEIIVAEIQTIPEDSIDSVWVKVARDQETQGWTRESDLLPAVSPEDPISQAIYDFSGNHVWGTFFLLTFLFLTLLDELWQLYRKGILTTNSSLSDTLHSIRLQQHFSSIRLSSVCSPYPILLWITLSGSAVFYASIQLFASNTWTEFYFHPTLNPFAVPPLLQAFLASCWLLLLFCCATVDDVLRQLSIISAFKYLLALVTELAVLYIFFSLTTLVYIGYPLYLLFIFFSIRYYFQWVNPRFRCGKCGHPLHEKGVCPHCGAINH